MKRTKRMITLIMSVIMAFAAFAGSLGCGRREQLEQVDTTRSQIDIGAFGGGFGTKWLTDLKTRFEEAYDGVSFEEGKEGVQVLINDVNKDKYATSTLLNQIEFSEKDVFFTSGTISQEKFAANGKVKDITDIVTKPLTEFGETKSIADKMNQNQKNFFSKDGRYYGLPDIKSTYALIYDVDLFEDKDLYFAKNGAPSEVLQDGGQFTKYTYTGTGAKSAGPDGEYGTFDDGCPATLEEYEVLVKRMDVFGIDAVIWMGADVAAAYANFLPLTFWASHNGTEANVLYNGGGSEGVDSRIITSFNGDEPVVETKKINYDNYKDIVKQAGFYYGFKMAEMLIKGGYVSDICYKGYNNIRTQDAFLVSRFREGTRPIAMISEGAWWENEATLNGTFDNNVIEFGEEAARHNRRFGIFPMPKVSTNEIGQAPGVHVGSSQFFVNGNVKDSKMELIETFIRFAHTDESLRRVTQFTGMPKAFDYELDDDTYDNLTYFGKQLWDYLDAAVEVTGLINPEIARRGLGAIYTTVDSLKSRDSANIQYGPFQTEFKYNKVTAKDYFLGMQRYAG